MTRSTPQPSFDNERCKKYTNKVATRVLRVSMPSTTPRLSSYPPIKIVLGFSLAVVIVANSEGTFPVKNENLTN